MTRIDDVINTSWVTISSGRLEEVVNDNELVVESAVVALTDDVRGGETPLAYVVLRGSGTRELSEEQVVQL